MKVVPQGKSSAFQGRRFFRPNPAQKNSPSALAEEAGVKVREAVYKRALARGHHVVTALKSWPGYDATGHILPAMDHTLANISAARAALDDLEEQITQFRIHAEQETRR